MNTPSLSTIAIQENVPLAPFTTFRIGGPCRKILHCQTPGQLIKAVEELNVEHESFILIGGGSNLVVSDQGIDCAVIRYVSDKPIIAVNGLNLTASGSTNLDDLVCYAANHGLKGLNYASGIPGTVGGGIVGNAGAFGKQLGDVLTEVVLLSRSGDKKIVKPDYLEFSYRQSKLKNSQDIVVEATFLMQPGDVEKLIAERKEIMSLRKEKHPDLKIHPCAGSFFKNVEPTSKAGRRQAAGWFLEQVGSKAFHYGGAKVFDRHANIIINDGSATAKNVYDLSIEMAAAVKKRFNLDLKREVRFVGHIEDMPGKITDFIW